MSVFLCAGRGTFIPFSYSSVYHRLPQKGFFFSISFTPVLHLKQNFRYQVIRIFLSVLVMLLEYRLYLNTTVKRCTPCFFLHHHSPLPFIPMTFIHFAKVVIRKRRQKWRFLFMPISTTLHCHA